MSNIVVQGQTILRIGEKIFSAILTVKTRSLPSYDKSIAETVSFKIVLTQTVADDLSVYLITFQV